MRRLVAIGLVSGLAYHRKWRFGRKAEPPLPSHHPLLDRRLGKSVKRLSAWVSQHRKSQKLLSKSVKGAKELWYRKDRQGSLWLALRFVPGAAEQYPGAPYHNFSSGAAFPLPLHSQHWWEVEGEPLDSRGRPKSERQALGSVLSTM